MEIDYIIRLGKLKINLNIKLYVITAIGKNT